MSFTNYGWGVTRPFRSLWPILSFSTLRTDYARVLQLNNLLVKLVVYTLDKLTTFKRWLNFSHLLFKAFLTPKVEEPIILIELFFYFKGFEIFARPYITKKNIARIKKLRKKRLKKKKLKVKLYDTNLYLYNIKSRRILKEKLAFRLLYYRRRYRRRIKYIYFKPKRAFHSFRLGYDKAFTLRFKEEKLRFRKLRFKRYRFMTTMEKRIKRLKLFPKVKQAYSFDISRLGPILDVYSNRRDIIYVYFLKKFLTIFNLDLSLNLNFTARLVNMEYGNINVYMNEFAKSLRRRESSPKTILKHCLRYLKENRKKFKITGAKVVAKGRFSKRSRVKPLRVFFGKVPLTGKNSRIEYLRYNSILRFGSASLNLYIRYAK